MTIVILYSKRLISRLYLIYSKKKIFKFFFFKFNFYKMLSYSKALYQSTLTSLRGLGATSAETEKILHRHSQTKTVKEKTSYITPASLNGDLTQLIMVQAPPKLPVTDPSLFRQKI